MLNGYFRTTAVAGIAAAVVTMAAWKAPQASSYLSAAGPAAATTAAPAPVPAAVAASSYAPVVERVAPAVVTIRVEKRASMVPTGGQIPDELRRFFGDQLPPQFRGQRVPRVQRGLGSGVIVSPDGYIITNNHVVDGVDTVKVELPDSRAFTAKVVGTDPATDLAVVKIDAKSLPAVVFGDSDAVKVGDVALAIGNPLNVGQTVTSGIISAKGRQTPDGSDGYQDFLQTDAAINHGNSGGALVNAGGQLIGIPSQILTPTDGNIGLGFAIPSNMAKHVMDQLIATGKVRRAKLGVTVQRITPDLAASLGLPNTRGALISNVDEGSPAAKAGVRQGDVITSYNGKPVEDNNQLRNAVAGTTPGSTVSLQVLRNGRTETLQATVAELESKRERVSTPSAERGEGRFGMTVEPGNGGVTVVELDPAGRAAESGLQEGDVIVKVDGRAVRSAAELKSALDRTDGKPSLLLVDREGTTIFLTIK
ncbi:MAG TPA: DegQ family serine endoprotease [Vicinamibacterales bacterium]|nr:DegQ family serine endoprotease [Vicinamibacterales bacterium]